MRRSILFDASFWESVFRARSAAIHSQIEAIIAPAKVCQENKVKTISEELLTLWPTPTAAQRP
jgi:hypothetical protein